MKYKIEDWIVYTDKKWSNQRKKKRGISLYGKIGKIIYIDNTHLPYLVEFKEFIGSPSVIRKGKKGYCEWCEDKEIISLDQLKLKKLLEG